MPHPVRQVTLAEAEREIEDGWIALYRGQSFVSRWIQYSTLGVYSHAAMLCRENGHVDVLELREWHGPRRLPLKWHVADSAGRIDVYAIDRSVFPGYRAREAVQVMRELTACSYSYRGVLTLGLRKLPFLRRFWALELEDDLTPAAVSAAFCSEAVAAADQFGGLVDAFPRKRNCQVTPVDLSQSPLRYLAFTIVGG